MPFKKRVRIVIVFLGFVVIPGRLAAEGKVSVDFGTFIETETNNAPYSGKDLTIAPGLILGVKGLEIPIYGIFQFENRMTAENTAGGYAGNELRQIYRIGGRVGSAEKFLFIPEFELRAKSYVGYSFSEKSNIENRFHLNFLIPAGRGWSIVFDTMPTLILSSGPAIRQQGATGNTTYYDFYNESLVGAVWKVGKKDSITAALYNELRDYQSYIWSDGSMNGGEIYLMNELQFRLSWSHVFDSKIVIRPFARIGIVRNEYFVDAGESGVTEHYRRDRYGVLLQGGSEGLIPYLEAYYQYQEQNGATPRNMFFWKVGLNYSI